MISHFKRNKERKEKEAGGRKGKEGRKEKGSKERKKDLLCTKQGRRKEVKKERKTCFVRSKVLGPRD